MAHLAGGHDVADHLEHPRRLAQPLRPAEQGELARAQPPVQVGVQRLEAGLPDPRRRRLALGELVVGGAEHLAECAQLFHAAH